MRRILLLSALVLLLDQATKFWVVEVLDLAQRRAISVFPPYLNFRMAWNEGINFGLFSEMGSDTMRWALVALALAVSAWAVWWGRRFSGWLGPSLVALLVGGAIGNSIDRIRYGAVADFLNMSCCGIDNPFSFNVADIAIFVGAVGLVLLSDKLPRRA